MKKAWNTADGLAKVGSPRSREIVKDLLAFTHNYRVTGFNWDDADRLAIKYGFRLPPKER